MRPPFNVDVIDRYTPDVLAAGHRILQTHRYADTDEAHVAVLLEHLDPPQGAIVVDNGCGVGEVSRLMRLARPDLRFLLVNLSHVQMAACPDTDGFLHYIGDSHSLDLPDECVDAVMFSSALSQMDEAVALREAYRLLMPGGVLLVNEPVRMHGDGAELERLLACRTLPVDGLLAAVKAAGFQSATWAMPAYTDAHFRGLLAKDGLEHLLEGVRPMIVRAVKQR